MYDDSVVFKSSFAQYSSRLEIVFNKWLPGCLNLVIFYKSMHSALASHRFQNREREKKHIQEYFMENWLRISPAFLQFWTRATYQIAAWFVVGLPWCDKQACRCHCCKYVLLYMDREYCKATSDIPILHAQSVVLLGLLDYYGLAVAMQLAAYSFVVTSVCNGKLHMYIMID